MHQSSGIAFRRSGAANDIRDAMAAAEVELDLDMAARPCAIEEEARRLPSHFADVVLPCRVLDELDEVHPEGLSPCHAAGVLDPEEQRRPEHAAYLGSRGRVVALA
jgi:hypothetical protein